MQPSVTRAARTVPEMLVPALTLVPLPRIIPWARRVEIMSAEVVIEYKEGITGSHFEVGGIDQMIVSLQVSSVIGEVLRLSTAALRVRSNLI